MQSLLLAASSQVSIPPSKGGAIEDIVYAIADSMSREMDVYIASPVRHDHPRIRYIVIKAAKRSSRLIAILQDFFFGIRLLFKIRELKPSIVHLNTTFTSLPVAALSFILPKETKFIYTSHSPAWTVPDSEIGLVNRLFNRLEAFVMRKAHIVTAVSNSMRNGITKKGGIDGHKVVVIPNFSRPDEFSPNYGKSWKKKHAIKGPMVLFVGKLTETKGVRYLIESIPRVLKKFPEARFVLVGSLEHEQELSKNPWQTMVENLGVAQNILFLGSVHRYELPKIYASADLFVLPTMREGMPLVILEAAASGLPIVTTKVSGIPEIVDEKSAVFVPRKNSEALADAIIAILRDPKTAFRMSKEARKAALKLDKGPIMAKYRCLYARLASN